MFVLQSLACANTRESHWRRDTLHPGERKDCQRRSNVPAQDQRPRGATDASCMWYSRKHSMQQGEGAKKSKGMKKKNEQMRGCSSRLSQLQQRQFDSFQPPLRMQSASQTWLPRAALVPRPFPLADVPDWPPLPVIGSRGEVQLSASLRCHVQWREWTRRRRAGQLNQKS